MRHLFGSKKGKSPKLKGFKLTRKEKIASSKVRVTYHGGKPYYVGNPEDIAVVEGAQDRYAYTQQHNRSKLMERFKQ